MNCCVSPVGLAPCWIRSPRSVFCSPIDQVHPYVIGGDRPISPTHLRSNSPCRHMPGDLKCLGLFRKHQVVEKGSAIDGLGEVSRMENFLTDRLWEIRADGMLPGKVHRF